MSVPALSTFKFILAWSAVDAPVPPSLIAISAIPTTVPPLIKTEFAFWVDIVPRPNDVLAVSPDSPTKRVPLPTMIFPSIGVIVEIYVKLELSFCLSSIWFWRLDFALSK